MDSSPIHDVVLPASVEKMISTIQAEKNQPPLKSYTRKMLAEIGEQASLHLLEKVRTPSRTITSFSGFVSHLVKLEYPEVNSSVLNAYGCSPQRQQTAPSSCPLKQKVVTGGTTSNGSMHPSSSNVRKTRPFGVACQLHFEDEIPEKRCHFERDQSDRGAQKMEIDQQLRILSELEFRKFFLVLSYIRRQKLEAVLSVEGAHEILGMRNLPMSEFEKKIWHAYGQRFAESDRIQYLDWDSGKTHLYHCHVDPDGSYYFKGPHLSSPRTHLQNCLGDDNILMVKFSEDGSYNTLNIITNGILVGTRRYHFFVFKDERKRAKKTETMEKKITYSSVKCYFYNMDSFVSRGTESSVKDISVVRRRFMHVHTVSTIEKYMARFSLILSKTIKLELDFANVKVEPIDDIPFKRDDGSIIEDEDGKPILHTDGTGYISEDLAMKCPKISMAVKYMTNHTFEKYDESNMNFECIPSKERGLKAGNKEMPLLMQCRLFHEGKAVKGTLLVNRKLGPGTIQIRPSMIKVERDPTVPVEETFNSLEIVDSSRKPAKTSLSRNLIALLSYGGVPKEFFLNLLRNALEETRNIYSNKRAALKVASNHEGMDFGFLAQRMISSGIPLNEPYLQFCLSKLESSEKTNLKSGKLPISDSFYLMGTADPTPNSVLNNDQVCVILENGQISGTVLVYRNPGMHFGDIHVMEAVYVKELEEIVGNAKYGIFFSAKGGRSAAYEMATGDFDGDKYWVSRNPELLEYFKPSEPWSRVYPVQDSLKRNPREFSAAGLENELFKLYLEARRPSFSMATASDSWFAYMDRLLSLNDDRVLEKRSLIQKMLQLVDIYYDALDAPKSGKKIKVPDELRAEMFPHHLERGHAFSYHSTSVLGQIYDTVQEFKNADVTRKEIWKMPFLLDVPVIETHLNTWRKNYANYRKEMYDVLSTKNASTNEAASDVIRKYKQLLYDAPEFEESKKETELIYEEAIAIYHVTYDYAMTNGVEKCGFAWKVAESALCSLCAWKLASEKEKPFTVLPSVLRELLN